MLDPVKDQHNMTSGMHRSNVVKSSVYDHRPTVGNMGLQWPIEIKRGKGRHTHEKQRTAHRKQIMKNPMKRARWNAIKYTRFGRVRQSQRQNQHKQRFFKRRYEDILLMPYRKLQRALLDDGLLVDRMGQKCPVCNKGVLGPLFWRVKLRGLYYNRFGDPKLHTWSTRSAM